MRFMIQNDKEEKPVQVVLEKDSKGTPQVFVGGKLLLWIREDGAVEFNGFLESDPFPLPVYPAVDAVETDSGLKFPKIVL